MAKDRHLPYLPAFFPRMNEDDLGDLEHFYGGMVMHDPDDLDFMFDDYMDMAEDWYYSDDDEFDQDSGSSDSDHNKIFVTLQGSQEASG